jgi:[DsrC]-trisulfide reductase subunit J
MKSLIIMQKLIMALVAIVFLGSALPVSAQQAGGQPAWMPKPPKAVGGKCDADPQWMRKWHMRALDHKRDETMRQGIRTKKYSLKNCISCHAVKDKNDKYITVKDERHFCRSCHDYAAVRIDCFDCHASRPDEKMDKAAKAAGNPHKDTARMSSPVGGTDTTVATLQKFIAGEGK